MEKLDAGDGKFSWKGAIIAVVVIVALAVFASYANR